MHVRLAESLDIRWSVHCYRRKAVVIAIVEAVAPLVIFPVAEGEGALETHKDTDVDGGLWFRPVFLRTW
jgi:hypothetical protein